MPNIASARGRLLRYSVAMIGPVGSAASQFVLSLVLLRRLPTTEFGAFSFLLIASQFSWGISSALFCAPMPILLATGDAHSRQATLRGLFTANLITVAIAFLAFLGVGLGLGLNAMASLLFAGYAAVALLRWFARAYAYATGAPLRTTASDIVYAVALLAGVGATYISHHDALGLAYASLLIAATLGMLPFGAEFLRGQFRHISLRYAADYASIWKVHSGWSLLGVLTTELTANAYVYIVTAIYGPGAFAPLAASSLMLRPINVTMNALTEFERAQMARQLAEGRVDLARDATRFFRSILIAAWTATTIAVFALLAKAPRLIFPAQYEIRVLFIGLVLWSAVTVVRVVRTPDSVLLQAAGAFRPLAFASVYSSGVSIVAVLASLALGGPLASIAGVLIGEMVFAAAIWRQVKRWNLKMPADVGIQPLPEPTLGG